MIILLLNIKREDVLACTHNQLFEQKWDLFFSSKNTILQTLKIAAYCIGMYV